MKSMNLYQNIWVFCDHDLSRVVDCSVPLLCKIDNFICKFHHRLILLFQSVEPGCEEQNEVFELFQFSLYTENRKVKLIVSQ